MTWCKHCELVGIYDEIGEPMNTDVIKDDNIDHGNSEPNAADNDLDREWGLCA